MPLLSVRYDTVATATNEHKNETTKDSATGLPPIEKTLAIPNEPIKTETTTARKGTTAKRQECNTQTLLAQINCKLEEEWASATWTFGSSLSTVTPQPIKEVKELPEAFCRVSPVLFARRDRFGFATIVRPVLEIAFVEQFCQAPPPAPPPAPALEQPDKRIGCGGLLLAVVSRPRSAEKQQQRRQSEPSVSPPYFDAKEEVEVVEPKPKQASPPPPLRRAFPAPLSIRLPPPPPLFFPLHIRPLADVLPLVKNNNNNNCQDKLLSPVKAAEKKKEGGEKNVVETLVDEIGGKERDVRWGRTEETGNRRPLATVNFSTVDHDMLALLSLGEQLNSPPANIHQNKPHPPATLRVRDWSRSDFEQLYRQQQPPAPPPLLPVMIKSPTLLPLAINRYPSYEYFTVHDSTDTMNTTRTSYTELPQSRTKQPQQSAEYGAYNFGGSLPHLQPETNWSPEVSYT